MTLLLVISVTALVSGVFLTAQGLSASQISAADNEATATVTAATSNNTTTTPATELNFTTPPFGMFMGMMEMHGRGPCGFGRNNIEVSSDYIANVTTIAKADTDVQALLNSGYNITRIMPDIKMTVDGNGNVALKASNATVLLENGTTGRAFATVDLSQSKVTQIVIFTKTVINKP